MICYYVMLTISSMVIQYFEIRLLIDNENQMIIYPFRVLTKFQIRTHSLACYAIGSDTGTRSCLVYSFNCSPKCN